GTRSHPEPVLPFRTPGQFASGASLVSSGKRAVSSTAHSKLSYNVEPHVTDIVIGSQSILGKFPDAPRTLRQSMEADFYPKGAALSRNGF
ncbi:MAG: hypothetical protein WBL40_12660, partial [Terrimicrobiaceae bacterium]